jgi:DNA-directed RNA polymerase specialized sigma24 family protein
MRPPPGRRPRARRQGTPRLQRLADEVRRALEPLQPEQRRQILQHFVDELRAKGLNVTLTKRGGP